MIERFVLGFLCNALWQATLLVTLGLVAERLARRTAAAARHKLLVGVLLLAVLLPARAALQSVSVPGSRPATIHAAAQQNGGGYALRLAIPPMAGAGILAAYLAFLGYGLARLAWGFAATLRLRRQGRPAPTGLQALAEHWRRRLGLGPVALRTAPVSTPLTVGTFRPLILLPAGLGSDADWVLLHELLHVRRRDFALNLACEALMLPLGFVPGLGRLRSRLQALREQACDEQVVSWRGDPHVYARVLLRVAAGVSRPRSYALALGEATNLEDRIMSLISMRNNARKGHAAAPLALVLSAAVGAPAFAISVQAAALPETQREPAPLAATRAEEAGTRRPARYTYVAAGRRDPFLRTLTQRPGGLEGCGTEEITLRGIVRTRSEAVALVSDPAGRSHFVRTGQRLYDGAVVAIEPEALRVRQQEQGPLAGERYRTTRVLLHPQDDSGSLRRRQPPERARAVW